MRALAEYIMRGRVQAALIAVLLVPVLPQAALALVTLRRGIIDGLWVAMWAFTPMLVAIWSDKEFLPMAMVSLGTLLTVLVTATLLRLQMTWATTLIALVVIITVLGVIFLFMFDAQISALVQEAIELQKTNLERQGIAYDESLMVLPANQYLLGLPSFGVAINVVIALVIGRWWQALLYNPGGFRQEFYQLRMQPAFAVVLGVVTVICVSTDYRYWSWLPALPLVMVSVSLAHQFAATQRMGGAWLVIYYLALFSMPFYLAMAAVGIVDSWTNMRSRLIPKSNTQGPQQGS